MLKAGLVYCDAVSTVSPRYAQEIQTPEFGCRLEGVLQHRRNELSGIINGVDYGVWNPERDRFLPKAYGPANVVEGKAAAKAALQKKLGLEVRPDAPLLGFIGRLVEQKGVDLILAVMTERLRTDDAQWVVLGGDGDPKLGEQLKQLAAQYPSKVAARIEKSEELAHLIEAASDVFLMPSRFEPCGLNQLYSLKYGTVPLVHAVGGLADSVVDATPENLQNKTATGFSFSGMTAMKLDDTLGRALDTYRNKPAVWLQLRQTGMSQDWSWDRSAKDYVELYRRMTNDVRNRAAVAAT
jgi:starch synthase